MKQPIDNENKKSRMAKENLPSDIAKRQLISRGTREAVATRIKQARESLGLTQKKAAEKANGMSLPSYKDYEAGKTMPGGEAIQDLTKLGINANWLLNGEGPMLLSELLGDALQDFVDAENLQKTAGAIRRSVAREPAAAPYGFLLVPRYDVAASMGNGAIIHSEQVVDHLAFREEWVRTELSANPKNLVLISAIGDSMEPTLRAGDLLLIDRSTAMVKQDAIYAFATNGELRVKRMQLKIDGSVVVKSDNPQYEAEFLTSEQIASLRIVGRVVWSGRRM